MKFPLFTWLLWSAAVCAAVPPEDLQFFEHKVRPILAQDCLECHSSTGKRKGGLALDSRAGWEAGGDSGPAIVPGDVEQSLLLAAIRHDDAELKMPSSGPKLEEAVIRDLEEWVRRGAPDPRDAPLPEAEIARDRAWPAVLERRKGWWSFQPPGHPAMPPETAWSRLPIDRFLQQAAARAGIAPAADAAPRVILRRLAYVLTGLPPTPEEVAAFEQASMHDLPGAVAAAADRYLASPRFGETWARHWMDWVRYAESHGSEGDPAIPYAWRYRDYLIRALNADVPYPQLVREHLAGDLLEHPRTNEELGINESALGTAHLRMVPHGFTPTDPLEEEITFVDNQIDTVAKAFLGLTVACARCHNHKFDAVSQADYYALFGIFASCRPATIDLNLPATREEGVSETRAARAQVQSRLLTAWKGGLGAMDERLEAWSPAEKERAAWLMEETGPLAAWLVLRDAPAAEWPTRWARLRERWEQSQAALRAFRDQAAVVKWDLRGKDLQSWTTAGAGLANGATPPGAWAVAAEGEDILSGIYPAGVYSHLLSERQRGVLASPLFTSEGGKLWVRVRGGGQARVRYVVRNYPRTGLIFPKAELTGQGEQWLGWDLAYWKGETLHVEISTEADQPVETGGKPRSWFGVSEVLYAREGTVSPPAAAGASLLGLLPPETPAPASRAELSALYRQAWARCLEHWAAGSMTDAEAEFLDAARRAQLLPNRPNQAPEAAGALASFRQAEARLRLPTRAPGVWEGAAFDQALLTRGDHHQPAAPVARRFLEAFDARPYGPGSRESGRRQLAESIVAAENPLLDRVIVNRLWGYVFGQGLVTTPDNFGRLGEAPALPELLDYLAQDFRAHGSSLKSTLRTLVTARAFRLEAAPSAAAAERDPANRCFSHFTARRLDAEAIRDTLLALTGQMETSLGGESVTSESPRRSVYVRVIRNQPERLLGAFDFPTPTATRGRRDSTNVPAQALALLNDPALGKWSAAWAARIQRETVPATEEARVERMFREAFGREARSEEMAACRELLQAGGGADPWKRLAHALANTKELIYLP